VIGKLFGTTDSDRRRTELIVLITPRVIRDQDDAKDVTRDLLRRYEGVLESVGRGSTSNNPTPDGNAKPTSRNKPSSGG
jgi:general secretion pathway protein D